jgi:ParB family chromosome partitioning protein
MIVLIDTIVCSDRIRGIDPDVVSALKSSIEDVGLLNPLAVGKQMIVRDGRAQDGYTLISGMHRLEAVKSLGWTAVPVTVLDLIGPAAIIAECDENLCGTNLSKAERALFTKHRKTAYEALHPETRNGTNQHTRVSQSEKPSKRFTADTAAKTGRAESDVYRDASRGDHIPEEILKEIVGTSLDTGVNLDRISHAPDPQAALDALKRERNQVEAQRRNREMDKTVALAAAEEFAQYLFDKIGDRELPMVITWMESCKPKHVTTALRRLAA